MVKRLHSPIKSDLIRAKIYVQVHCPKCGFIMMCSSAEKAIWCTNGKCELYKTHFEIPTINLKRIER